MYIYIQCIFILFYTFTNFTHLYVYCHECRFFPLSQSSGESDTLSSQLSAGTLLVCGVILYKTHRTLQQATTKAFP